MIGVFAEWYFRTDYNYVVTIVNFKGIQMFREDI